MSFLADLKSLHPLEVKTLLTLSDGERFDVLYLSERLGFKAGQGNQAVSWLQSKGLLVEVERTTELLYERTELGAEYAQTGTPAQRVLDALRSQGPMTMPEIAAASGLPNRDVGSTYGRLSKEGSLSMGEGKRVEIARDGDPDAALTTLLARGDRAPLRGADLDPSELSVLQSVSKKRGAADAMFRVVERDHVLFELTAGGSSVRDELRSAGLTGEEIGQVTAEHLQRGSWKNASFRPYGVNAPTSRLIVGRRNAYCEYLDSVKDKLTSLGFEEFDGPLVETEFWNSDALFMPQFHSARDIHDVYYVKEPDHAREIEEPYLSNVAQTHENGWTTGSRGWGYAFDRDFTRRLILRSQGTVMSAKTLHTAKIPGKYFGVLRCFRYDQVDATHLSDFYQTEGIVLGEEVNLRNLLGLLRMFAEELAGATEVKYVPGYFPFTEPSVEVHIKHPVLGWFELGGSGIFRPEVTRPMGIDVPVLAWGLGIDRMALMHLGLNDLRDLFSGDLESVRLRRRAG